MYCLSETVRGSSMTVLLHNDVDMPFILLYRMSFVLDIT